EFTQVGGQILTLGAAFASLQARQAETSKSLREASERELAAQVKLNTLQETLNRETARAEKLKHERAAAEAALKSLQDEAERHSAAHAARESERQRTLEDLDDLILGQGSRAERLKAEIKDLEERRAEFAQIEARLQNWQDIEARLRGQLIELEEKHEILRHGLGSDESTVIMFANDIIKRLDLVDALMSRYAGQNGGDVVSQLRTLRHSFEDILLQHGVSEFDVDPGTEVDVPLRKRITIVESLPGKNKPRVVESCRSGFIYSREEGHEVVLRKVEVRISSN
ncbi:MAG TPA: hypothetical protein DIT13_15385, partial [Verrucomicrobiales bacterium]|nr:hypothetical protein [Verrucomicrobiales bacterium]